MQFLHVGERRAQGDGEGEGVRLLSVFSSDFRHQRTTQAKSVASRKRLADHF